MKRVDKEIWVKPQDNASSELWNMNLGIFDLVFNYYSTPTVDLISVVIIDDMNSREKMRIKNEF